MKVGTLKNPMSKFITKIMSIIRNLLKLFSLVQKTVSEVPTYNDNLASTILNNYQLKNLDIEQHPLT